MDIPNYLLPTRASLRNRAGGQSYHERIWHAPAGVTPAHVMNPDLWVHVAEGMPPDSRIEIVGDDFDMELRVVGVDPRGKYLIVRCLRFCDGKGVAVPGMTDQGQAPIPQDSDGYAIEEDGMHRWRIFRHNDLIAKDLPSKAAALSKLAELRSANRVKKVA